MSPKKQQRKKRKKQAEEQRRRRRVRQVRIVVAATVLAAIVAGALVIPGLLQRRARMQRVHVYLGHRPDTEPFGVLADGLPAPAPAGQARENAPPEADPPPEADAAPVLGDVVLSYPGSPEGPPVDDRDVVIARAPFGSRPTGLVAVDPYVVVVDTRAGASPLDDGDATLNEVTAWLEELDTDRWMPMVVAGENDVDFAAFILYLARELVSPQELEPVQEALEASARRAGVGMAGARADGAATARAEGPADVSPEELESLVAPLQPVIDFLQDWESRGLLAFNWTNWDRIALRDAQRQGRAALTFEPRSELGAAEWEERFHLRLRLPAVGPQRRLYRMIGSAVAVHPGEGPRSDAAASVMELLRESDVQNAVETETDWSPVQLEGTPINRQHRDVVRWVAGAEDYLVIDDATAAHPLFERAHQLLR